MSEAFAQKLRLWLVSMMTLLLGTVSASVATLLSRPCTASNVWNCIAMSGHALVMFVLLLVPLAAWHACDLVQRRKPGRRLASLLVGYPMLSGTLSLLLLLHALNATGRFLSIQDCGGLFVVLSQACVVTEAWLLRPMLILLLLLALLTLAKGIFVAHSRLLTRP